MNAFVFAGVTGNLPFEKEEITTVIKLNYCSITQNMLVTEPESRVHVLMTESDQRCF
jgi:hypothetical protein